MVRPPEALLTECPQIGSAEEVLLHLKKKDVKAAATAYVRYVLDARDALDVCNARIAHIRRFYTDMQNVE